MSESSNDRPCLGYCTYCHIRFGTHETRVYKAQKPYHPTCREKQRRQVSSKKQKVEEKLDVVPIDDIFADQLKFDFKIM